MLFSPIRRGPVLPLRIIFSVPVAIVLFLFYMIGNAFIDGFYRPHFYIIRDGNGGIGDVLVVVFFTCFFFLALLSYLRCVITHPGIPVGNAETHREDTEMFDNSKRFCKDFKNFR